MLKLSPRNMPDSCDFQCATNYDEVLEDKALGHIESDTEQSDAPDATTSTSQDSQPSRTHKQSKGVLSSFKDARAEIHAAQEAITSEVKSVGGEVKTTISQLSQLFDEKLADVKKSMVYFLHHYYL